MPILSEEMKALVEHFQKQWKPLQEKGDLLTEEALSTFTEKDGKNDRKKSPDVYIQNALRILDFFALQVPDIMKKIIEEKQNEGVVATMNAIHTRSKKHIRSAAFYLDDKHCVPNLPNPKDPNNLTSVANSKKLFEKCCLLVWFMNEFYHFDKKFTRDPQTTLFITTFIDNSYNQEAFEAASFWVKGAIRLIPERKRLSTLEKNLLAYQIANGINSRPEVPALNLKAASATNQDEKVAEFKPG
jgi:hypothetical protein